jgi:hypothetical protein
MQHRQLPDSGIAVLPYLFDNCFDLGADIPFRLLSLVHVSARFKSGNHKESLATNFVSKARSNEPFTVTIQDGLRSLTLAEAACRSAEAHLPISISALS